MRKLSFLSCVAFVLYLLGLAFHYPWELKGTGRPPWAIDFAAFHVAAKMAADGLASALYTHEAFFGALGEVLDPDVAVQLPWHYPPSFLLFLMPVILLPIQVSFALWLAVTLAAAFFAARRLVPQASYLLLGFPGILMTFDCGQNAFLSTALLAGALAFLETKAWVSGLMFGLLSFKPQLAVVPFLMLLLFKQWRVFGWAVGFAALLALLSVAAFGIAPWEAFIASFFSSDSHDFFVNAWEYAYVVRPTLYSALRLAGAGGIVSGVVIAFVAILSLAVVREVWKEKTRFALKGAAFVLAILLASPFYLQHDLMLLSLPLMLLAWDYSTHGSDGLEKAVLFCLWLSPLATLVVVCVGRTQIGPLILLSALAAVERRARKTTKVPSASAA